MRAKRAGRILNVSSVGGMMAMPTMAVYRASKFAPEGATESLWYEVRPWTIRVTLIQPGFINSTSFHNTRFTALSRTASEQSDLAYARRYRNMRGFIERMMLRMPATPDTVARRMLSTIERRHRPLRVAATFNATVFCIAGRSAAIGDGVRPRQPVRNRCRVPAHCQARRDGRSATGSAPSRAVGDLRRAQEEGRGRDHPFECEASCLGAGQERRGVCGPLCDAGER